MKLNVLLWGWLVWLLVACTEPKPKPVLQLQDLEGKGVSLAQLQGKKVVVNVWATWCAPCRREMPLLQQAQKQHPDVVFVLLNQGDSSAAINTFLSQNGLQFAHVWQDPQMQARNALSYQALPSTYFINRGGELVSQSVGELHEAELQRLLAQMP